MGALLALHQRHKQRPKRMESSERRQVTRNVPRLIQWSNALWFWYRACSQYSKRPNQIPNLLAARNRYKGSLAAWLQCVLRSREIKPLLSREGKKFFY